MKENFTFIFKNDKPFLIKVVGGLILLFAIIKIMHTPLYGIILVAMSGGLFLYQSGIEIDFVNKKYRILSTFGPQTFGKWIELPELKYISVFKTNIVHTATGISGASVSKKDAIIQISLVSDQNKKIKVYEGKDIQQAFGLAKAFSKSMSVDIWDATIRPADWYVAE